MSAPVHVCGGRCTLGYKTRAVVSICRPGDHPTGAKKQRLPMGAEENSFPAEPAQTLTVPQKRVNGALAKVLFILQDVG